MNDENQLEQTDSERITALEQRNADLEKAIQSLCKNEALAAGNIRSLHQALTVTAADVLTDHQRAIDDLNLLGRNLLAATEHLNTALSVIAQRLGLEPPPKVGAIN